MNTFLLNLSTQQRWIKQCILAAGDVIVLPFLFWLTHVIRLDTDNPDVLSNVHVWPVWVALGCVFALYVTGVYHAIVRAFDENFLQKLIIATLIVAFVLFVVASLRITNLPRSTAFSFGFFMFLWVWVSRSGIRWFLQKMLYKGGGVHRVAIYGAGNAGRQLLAALRASAEKNYLPVAFFDDDRLLIKSSLMGLRVYAGKDFAKLYEQLQIDEVLLAIPSASRSHRKHIITMLEPFKVHVRSLPAVTQLVDGEVSLSDIREVDIADLLGRDAVPPEPSLMAKDICGKVVMVTGAGGSIGSELCRQILLHRPAKLLLLERAEYSLYIIEQELKKVAGDIAVLPLLGSVMHEDNMVRTLQMHGVQTIYHAAAYKHVPLVEWNPFEGLMNNTLGTWRTACAAVRAGVSTFVLISTDKAVRPTNVMGATKRLAELGLQALAKELNSPTRFCMVRFGNVLGSSGSVVPLFREQIAAGGPVTVTHPEITRFFMTIPEASQLVIQAGAMGEGGDVFVLDMGESVKIVDLARKMIRLSGRSLKESDSHEGDIEIHFTGLRPGEKIYEELLIGSDVYATTHPRIMRAMERSISKAEYEALVVKLLALVNNHDVVSLKQLLKEVVEGYVPDFSDHAMYLAKQAGVVEELVSTEESNIVQLKIV